MRGFFLHFPQTTTANPYKKENPSTIGWGDKRQMKNMDVIDYPKK